MSQAASIPPAPRNPRWRPALRHRWVLGVISAALLFASTIVLLIQFAAGGDLLPLGDDALDAASNRARGEVIAVSETGIHSGGRHWLRVDFKFEAIDGQAWYGSSFCQPYPGLEPGAEARVEYLPDAPEISRIEGSRRSPLGKLWTTLLGLLVLPSILLFLFWIRGVFRLRLLLSTGIPTGAGILDSRSTVGVNPPQFRVTYRYRDTRGTEQQGTHWVGQATPLGRELAAGAEVATAVYDEAEPERSRLAHAEDFLT